MVLAPAIYWRNLPKTYNLKLRPYNGATWSNPMPLRVEWGGGGTGW